MKKIPIAVALVVCTAGLASAQSPSTVVHGIVTGVDAATKTMVVSTEKGGREVVHVARTTVFHGAAVGGKGAFHGLKEGSVVAAHTTSAGARKVATEIDVLGKDGLKALEGTLSRVDALGKQVVVRAADGSEHVFKLTEHAALHAAKVTARGTTTVGKATVYYTETGGGKVAHFFEHL
jgi:tartrate dehydratase beta subunit/fumarate hydratase class I family protein